MDHERGFILEKQPEQLPDGVMKDGKRTRERKKGSSTAAALSAVTEEMKSAAKETKELKIWMMDSLKKQNGREATSTETDVSEADEQQELRTLNALNADMHQLVKSIEKTSDMIASLKVNGADLRHYPGSAEDEEAYHKKKRERLEALVAIEASLLKSAKRRK